MTSDFTFVVQVLLTYVITVHVFCLDKIKYIIDISAYTFSITRLDTEWRSLYILVERVHHGRDCVIVGLTTNCAICAYHHGEVYSIEYYCE